MPSKEYEHFKNFSSRTLPVDERRKIWMELSNMTDGNFDKMFADQKLRQELVPEVGKQAPDFEAEILDPARERSGETVKLWDLRGKPVALVFGSYTWPPSRGQAARQIEIFEAYKTEVQFFMVYISEANPSDGWVTPQNLYEEIDYDQPTDEGQRAEVAHACQLGMEVKMPMLIDSIDNDMDKNTSPSRPAITSSAAMAHWYSMAPRDQGVSTRTPGKRRLRGRSRPTISLDLDPGLSSAAPGGGVPANSRPEAQGNIADPPVAFSPIDIWDG